jgi:hypothetical protein
MAGEARCRRSTKSAEFRRSSATVYPTSSGEYELVPNPAKPVDSEWAKNKYPPAQADGREAAHSGQGADLLETRVWDALSDRVASYSASRSFRTAAI